MIGPKSGRLGLEVERGDVEGGLVPPIGETPDRGDKVVYVVSIFLGAPEAYNKVSLMR